MKVKNSLVYPGAALSIFLLMAGLLALPFGEGPGIERSFALIWIAVALASALTFSKEVWKRERLKKFQVNWKSNGRSRGVDLHYAGRVNHPRTRVHTPGE